jgi:putative transposase
VKAWHTLSFELDAGVRADMSHLAVIVRCMRRVIKLRMLPTRAEAAALDETLRVSNAASSWLSQQMHSAGVFRKIDAHHRFYTELRERFGLAAQPAIRVIGRVADAYASRRATTAAGAYGSPGSNQRRRLQATPIRFRASAAQPFDARCLSWKFPEELGRNATVSIRAVSGRLKNVPILGAPKQMSLLRARPIGESDLICRDGKWYLHSTIEVPEATPCNPVNGFLGVDMGIVNIATTSAGKNSSGARLNSYRKRQLRLRKRLQAKKTTSARRLLRKRRRKETRFATDINHKISKGIVAEAERTGRGIAVEQLTGIRDRVRLRKPQRAMLHSWAFAQLGFFLAYKARQAGVAFVQVDPSYTSQACSACGWVDKKNRRTQSAFKCGRCGFVGHADHNAAINIATRGVQRWGEVMRPHAAPTLTAS